MLIVAPNGSTKLAMSFLAPSFSEQSRLIGRVPTEEALENAIAIAGAIPLKNFAIALKIVLKNPTFLVVVSGFLAFSSFARAT